MLSNCPPPDMLLASQEGVLPEALAREIEHHLAACPICRQLQQDLGEQALAAPSLAEMERLRRRVLRPAEAKARWPWLAAAAAAAVMAIGGAVSVAWRQVASQPPAPPVQTAQVAQPASPVAPVYRLPLEPAPLRLPLGAAVLLRGKEQDASTAYLEALGQSLTAYREGRFGAAAGQLRTLGQRFPKAVEPPLYEGVSRLLSGDAAGALASLEQARRIGGEAVNEDIAWYRAVAAERSGHWDQALALLQPLCATEGPHRAASCRALAQK